jgi:prevent-host-death family protein
MLKQVTVTELQRRAAEVIGQLADEPVIISQRGRPAAVLLAAEVFERIERALEEVEARKVQEIVEAGLASYKAGKLSSHADVARRARQARSRRKRA